MSFFRRRRAILDSILRNLINIGLGAAGLPDVFGTDEKGGRYKFDIYDNINEKIR
jgi:hypothetical protein